MKITCICLSFYLLLITSLCYSQKTKIIDSISRPEVQKFAGTWKWVSDSAEFIIFLQKATGVYPNKISEPILVGVHSYKINGKVIEDYLNDSSSIGFKTKGTIFLKAKYDGTNPDEVDGSIKDTPKDKPDYLSLIYNNTTIPSLTLYLNNMSDPRKKKKKSHDYTFTFPSNIVLVKQ